MAPTCAADRTALGIQSRDRDMENVYPGLHKVVKIEVSSELTKIHNIYPLPLAKLKADGQEVSCMVDSGASALFLVWRKWFEAVGQNYDTCVSLFPHAGNFDLGSGLSTQVNIGLVADFSHSPERIWASLGLSASTEEWKPYLSIAQQLAAKKIIKDESFSIYFNGERFASGGIILGGEDPSKQEGPLKFFKIVNDDEQFVQLHGLQVGDDPKYLMKMKYPAVFDTGSSHIYINKKWKAQVLEFLQEAGKKKFKIREERSKFIISCSDAENVPSLTFTVEGLQGEKVALEVSPEALVWKYEGDDCLLRIDFDDDDASLFGMPAFLGNYYYFSPTAKSIGHTKAKL
ncbi:hypothetical protein FOL47_002422 [Perkinsus chesapeaki]|uniref:Peptidase A1 domain-containing protein n=1 Tax=Perkinsus chesapeaki TaxID=330153 RepID=A0A7J6KR95_PERCH|nr:hypothetical protein FOL47_002422 [Perkinsus chesapeaki]